MKDNEKSADIDDPQLWLDRVRSYRDYNKTPLDDHARFSRWYAGNQEELRQTLVLLTGDKRMGTAPLANHVHINTCSLLSELMFRAPRAYVSPQTNFGPGVFSKKLAAIETTLINDLIDETDFYGEGRRAIVDGLVGPMMIAKVGYSNEIAQDDEMMEAEKRHAQVEDMAIIGGGRPKVSNTDYHPGHIEQHTATLAQMENGTIPVPAAALRYLKKHIKFHEEAATEDGRRPLETVRHESVFIERTSPQRFACDPMASSPSRRRWVGEWFMRPIEDVRNDRRYDREARKHVVASDVSELDADETKRTRNSEQCGEDFALLFEGVDLVQGKVVTFAKGSETLLRFVDYADIRIRPAGPYITASFVMDPLRDAGFSLPRIYEGHQEMASYMATLIAIQARRSMSSLAVPAGKLTPADIESIKRGVPAALLQLKGLNPGETLDQIIQRVPAPEPTPAMFAAKQDAEFAAARFAGLGEAKTGGGDTSKTATASAIVDQSVSGLSDDRASVLDDWMTRIFRDSLRVMRKRYGQNKVADIVGPVALDEDGWPVMWSERDIVRDKGVSVIPGSSKRKNAAVDVKLLTELLTVGTQIPALMQSPTILVELFRRVSESAGVFNLDLGEAEDAAKMQAIQQLMAGGGQPEQSGMPEQGGQGMPPRQSKDPSKANPNRRARTRGEGTPSAVNQGAQNVGGGRIPGGA